MRLTTFSFLALLSLGAHAQPGTWDTSFGINGKVLVPTLGTGADDQAVTGVVLPDGKILVAGQSLDDGQKKSVLLRFDPDGSPDLTFGTEGVVFHDLSAGDEMIRSSALDAQGRLVVGGHLISDDLTNSDMFVARFLPDGSLDPSFNGTGLLIRDMHTTPDAEEAHEVLVQPDGKIILCGFTGPSPELTEIVVERYLDNGGLDPTFGGDGSVLAFISNGSGEQVRGAVLGSNGDIYFCGYVIPSGETEQAVLLGRINSAGDSPSDFGNNNGHSYISVSGSNLIARTVALMPDGGLVVAGAQRTPGASQARFIYTFDASGDEVANSFQDNDGADAWNALLVQNNGSIISGGNVGDGPDSRNWNVERTDAGLGFDPAFDAPDYEEDNGGETCLHLEFTSDSSIIGIGIAEVDFVVRIALLKYRNDITSGMSEQKADAWVSAFPNPVMDRTMLTFAPGAPDVAGLSLMDAQGRVVRTWPAGVTKGTSRALDLSGVVPGMYGLRVDGGGRTTILKLVKH